MKKIFTCSKKCSKNEKIVSTSLNSRRSFKVYSLKCFLVLIDKVMWRREWCSQDDSCMLHKDDMLHLRWPVYVAPWWHVAPRWPVYVAPRWPMYVCYSTRNCEEVSGVRVRSWLADCGVGTARRAERRITGVQDRLQSRYVLPRSPSFISSIPPSPLSPLPTSTTPVVPLSI